MSKPEAYVKEIKSLTSEIKRSDDRIKGLKEQRKSKQKLLFKYMDEHELEKYEGITINSIRPKDSIKRKSEKEKRKDAIDLFRQIGIENPEEFYLEFKNTQRIIRNNDEDDSDLYHYSQKRSKKEKKGKSVFDPFLGF